MRLVVDTNIIISAAIRNSGSRKILLHPGFELYMPEYAVEEIERHFDEISSKTGLAEKECRILLNALLSSITMIPNGEFRDFIPKADKIMDEIDPDDAPFLACALSFKNYGIWSEDSDFMKQNAIRVWKTKELLGFI